MFQFGKTILLLTMAIYGLRNWVCCTTDYQDLLGVTKFRMGNHALIPTRDKGFSWDSCFRYPSRFLKKSAPELRHRLRPKELAKLWMAVNRVSPNLTFFGAEETVSAFREGQSINVILDEDYFVHRYIMRNALNGELYIIYDNEDNILTRLAANKTWTFTDMIQCQSLVSYLSQTYGAYRTSFALVRRNSSYQEQEFISFTGGIAGFYRN